MAATRWRVVGVDVVGGGALELSALHLYDGAGARIDIGAALGCTVSPVAGMLSALQDADADTLCRFSPADVRAGGFALVWDFPSAVEVGAVRLGAGDNRAQFPDSLTLEYLDAGAWVRKGTFGAYPWPGPRAMVAPPSSNGDLLYLNVALLLHGDDAIDATTLLDSSQTPKTVLCYGGAKVESFASAFGGRAIRSPPGGYALVSSDDALNFASGDWCIELDYWPISVSTSQILFNKANATGAPYPVQVYVTGDRKVVARSYDAVGAQVWQIDSSNNVSLGSRNSICVSRSGATLRLFINGTLQGQTSYAGLLPENIYPIAIGAYSNGMFSADGYIEELRITMGQARHTSNYTPSTSAFPDAASGDGLVFEPLASHTRVMGQQVVRGAPPAQAVVCGAKAISGRDFEFGGPGRIWGTAETEIAPGTKVPTKARISVLRQRDRLLAREVWSDPVTGTWEVQGLDTAQQFIALAQDPTGAYRPVAADQTTPETTP